MPELEHPIFEIPGRPQYGAPPTPAPSPRTGANELMIIHNDLASIKSDLDAWIAGSKPLPENWDREALVSGTKKDYEVKTIALDAANTDLPIFIQGNVLAVWTDGAISDLSLRVNHLSASALPLRAFVPLAIKFYQLFLSNSAQTGKTLYLFAGRGANVAALGSGSVGPSEVPIPHFFTTRSDKDTEFTGAIAQYAMELEALGWITSPKIRIVKVAMEADQALDWRLIFWSKSTADDTDLDVDSFEGDVELDMASFGFQIAGAGQYYMEVDGLDIYYANENGSKVCQVALQNLSATAKNAGATGEVTVKLTYEEYT